MGTYRDDLQDLKKTSLYTLPSSHPKRQPLLDQVERLIMGISDTLSPITVTTIVNDGLVKSLSKRVHPIDMINRAMSSIPESEEHEEELRITRTGSTVEEIVPDLQTFHDATEDCKGVIDRMSSIAGLMRIWRTH
jgi:hypothetical protein